MLARRPTKVRRRAGSLILQSYPLLFPITSFHPFLFLVVRRSAEAVGWVPRCQMMEFLCQPTSPWWYPSSVLDQTWFLLHCSEGDDMMMVCYQAWTYLLLFGKKKKKKKCKDHIKKPGALFEKKGTMHSPLYWTDQLSFSFLMITCVWFCPPPFSPSDDWGTEKEVRSVPDNKSSSLIKKTPHFK